MSRWTGNGLSNGTAVTTGNVNTAGNGDTMARVASSSPNIPTTFATAGDGFEVGGTTAATVARLDATISTTGAIAQFFYTPPSAPTSGNETIYQTRNSGAQGIGLRHATTGALLLVNSTSVGIAGSTSPALTNGDRYQIDVVNCLHSSPTTSNGRVFYKVKNLDDSSWNTTGSFFFDSGYAINSGTTTLTAARFGKNAGGIYTGNQLFEQLGWDQTTVNTSHTSQAQAEAYFMVSPYAFTPSMYRWNGSAYVGLKGYRWNGSAYVEVDTRRWNGSAYV